MSNKKNKNWGGPRAGSGRVPLDTTEKKKGAQIYITDRVKEEVAEYGIGNSFSEKALDLIISELHRRKNVDETEE